jgi:hypothetical protein
MLKSIPTILCLPVFILQPACNSSIADSLHDDDSYPLCTRSSQYGQERLAPGKDGQVQMERRVTLNMQCFVRPIVQYYLADLQLNRCYWQRAINNYPTAKYGWEEVQCYSRRYHNALDAPAFH